MSLESHIQQIREALREGRFTSEAAVSQGVVLPTLNALGWPVFNTSVVTPEYSVEGLRVDYALCHPVNRPAVFIEVKKVGLSEGADRQLFEYAFHVGVPMAILTDGQEWSFYLPGEQGHYAERRVYKLDLLERDVSEVANRLRKYLSYEETCSGETLRAARDDYRDVARQREIDTNLPRAWNRLLDERDSLLLDLLAEKVEDLCGYKPEPDVCEQFIGSLRSSVDQARSNITNAPFPQPAARTTQRSQQRARQRTVDKFNFSFQGTEYEAGSAREVMTQIFRHLAKADPGFLERFAARKHGRKRRYIAKDKMELYPGRPDLAENASIEVVSGWWLGTNYSRHHIQQIIDLAKEVVEPAVGRSLRVKVE